MSALDAEEQAAIRQAETRLGAVLRGKWRIDKLLGVGGMAAVYEGTHRNGKRGAIKVLHPMLSADEESRKRFLREGYVANKIDHPGVVSVLDDDIAEDGTVFLVMELLSGQNLSDLTDTRAGDKLSIGEALKIGDALCDVLAAAHEKGVLHRDVKPENLFLTKDGALKVLDFGIASVRESSHATRLTKTGAAMGTPAFMAPEQALGEWEKVDPRTDVWAIGATLFTLMTGRLVHEAPGLNQLLLKAMTARARPLREVLPQASMKVAAAVDRALAFEQAARFSDARAMQKALRDAIAELEARGQSVVFPALAGANAAAPGPKDALSQSGKTARRRAPIAFALGLGLVVVGLTATLVFAMSGEENAPAAAPSASPAPTVAAPTVTPVGVEPPRATATPAIAPSASPSLQEPLKPAPTSRPTSKPTPSSPSPDFDKWN